MANYFGIQCETEHDDCETDAPEGKCGVHGVCTNLARDEVFIQQSAEYGVLPLQTTGEYGGEYGGESDNEYGGSIPEDEVTGMDMKISFDDVECTDENKEKYAKMMETAVGQDTGSNVAVTAEGKCAEEAVLIEVGSTGVVVDVKAACVGQEACGEELTSLSKVSTDDLCEGLKSETSFEGDCPSVSAELESDTLPVTTGGSVPKYSCECMDGWTSPTGELECTVPPPTPSPTEAPTEAPASTPVINPAPPASNPAPVVTPASKPTPAEPAAKTESESSSSGGGGTDMGMIIGIAASVIGLAAGGFAFYRWRQSSNDG